MSGVHVYHSGELGVYLKVDGEVTVADLNREKDVLRWLEGKAPVPRVLEFESSEGKCWLLIAEIEGRPEASHPLETIRCLHMATLACPTSS